MSFESQSSSSVMLREVNSSHSYFKGYRGLSALGALKDLTGVVTSVRFEGSSGHLAMVLHQGRQLVLFDRVPESMQLDEKETHKLSRLIRGEVTDWLHIMLVVRCNTAPLIEVDFSPANPESGAPLRLSSLYCDGFCVVWNWDRLGYRWQYLSRVKLADGLGPHTDSVLLFCPLMLGEHLTKRCLTEAEVSKPQHLKKEINDARLKMIESMINPVQTTIDVSSDSLEQSSSALISPLPSLSLSSSSSMIPDSFALMIDYWCYPDSSEVRSSELHTHHRKLLARSTLALGGFKDNDSVSSRFVIQCCRLRNSATFESIPSGMTVLMDSVEEIEFWKAELHLTKCFLLIERCEKCMLGFLLEMTVRDESAKIRRRLIYYVAVRGTPGIDSFAQLHELDFPVSSKESSLSTVKEESKDGSDVGETTPSMTTESESSPSSLESDSSEGCILGIHSDTKQCLCFNPKSGELHILREKQRVSLSANEESAPHRIESPSWAGVCRLQLPFWKYDCSDLKLLAMQDWVCIVHTSSSDRVRMALFHLTAAVLHRRKDYYDWREVDSSSSLMSSEEDRKSSDIESGGKESLLSPFALYKGRLYNKSVRNTQSVPPCHVIDRMKSDPSSLSSSSESEGLITSDIRCVPKLGFLVDGRILFELDMQLIRSQVSGVISLLSPAQRTIAGLNALTRWKDHCASARGPRSKFLCDFIWRQSLNRNSVTASQMKEALESGAPLPLLLCLLWRAPHFDDTVLSHYLRMRKEQTSSLCTHFGSVFGLKLTTDLLNLLNALRTDEMADLLLLQKAKPEIREDYQKKKQEWNQYMAEDTIVLTGQGSLEEDMNDADLGIITMNDDDNSDNNEDSSDDNDIDTIRSMLLLKNHHAASESDLTLLESKLKLTGLRDDPFDLSSFPADHELLASLLLLNVDESSTMMDVSRGESVSTPLRSTLSSLCRMYDTSYPLAMMRLVQVLSYGHSSSAPEIASRVLNGLKDLSHGLKGLKQDGMNDGDTTIVFEDESLDHPDFNTFEQRIVCRVILCKMARQYYAMLDYMLRTPLTVSRLSEAIKTALKFEDRLNISEKALIFKRLLDAWIDCSLDPLTMKEEGLLSESDWITQLRPDSFNGFHFIKHLTEAIERRKRKKIALKDSCSDKNDDGPSILAGKGDVSVKTVRKLLLFFAKELQPLR